MDLNPFKKEIYGTILGGRLVLMTSIEGKRKIAHKTGKYLGCKIDVAFKEDKPHKARAIAKKLVGSHVAEFEAVVYFEEFSKGGGNWKTMPVVMLQKCAESAVLRMAFPALDELYDESEKVLAEAAQDATPVDTMPDYELESQAVDDPGEYLVKIGSRKAKPAKLKEIPRNEIEEFVTWASSQEKLPIEAQQALSASLAFLQV
jgi:hypothetical protein